MIYQLLTIGSLLVPEKIRPFNPTKNEFMEKRRLNLAYARAFNFSVNFGKTSKASPTIP